MTVRPPALLLVLPLLACGPEEPQPRNEPPPEAATAPAAAPAPAPPALVPAADTPVVADDATGLRAEIVPPVAIERPSPDWSRFPGGHLPGPGGTYRLRIDERGTVTDVQVVRAGHPEVDAVILETLRRWRFQPATKDGEPVAVSWHMSVNIDVR
jgi:protein TonB